MKAKDSHFDKLNDSNDFKDKLIQSLGNKANQWKPGTSSTVTTVSTTTMTSFRIKRNVAVAWGLFQLAGFALSLFNRQVLLNIKKASETMQTQHKYVAAKTEEALMRLSNLTSYPQFIHQYLVNIAKTQNDFYTTVKREGLANEIAQMKRLFLSEFTLFTGFQSLVEGRFSPLLVNPDLLQSTYDDVISKSR